MLHIGPTGTNAVAKAVQAMQLAVAIRAGGEELCSRSPEVTESLAWETSVSVLRKMASRNLPPEHATRKQIEALSKPLKVGKMEVGETEDIQRHLRGIRFALEEAMTEFLAPKAAELWRRWEFASGAAGVDPEGDSASQLVRMPGRNVADKRFDTDVMADLRAAVPLVQNRWKEGRAKQSSIGGWQAFDL